MLSFQHPWWLLLALLPLLALWLLRVPRKGLHRLTYRLEIWIRAARELNLLQPRGHFLRDLPLVAALLCFSLVPSGPRWGARRGAGTLLVVLDRSPSMGASLGAGRPGKDRFTRALEILESRMGALPPGLEVRVLGAGGPRLLREDGRAGEFAPLAERLRSWGVASRGRARLEQVLEGLAPLGLPLLVLSDFAGPEKQAPGKAPPCSVRWVRVGRPLPNGALLEGLLLPDWPSPEVTARFLVRGSLLGRSLVVRPAQGGKVLARLALSFPPGRKGAERVTLSWERAAGPVRVSLEPGDAFPWDDTLLLEPPPLPALRVALREGDPGEGPSPAVRALLEGLTAGKGKIVEEDQGPDLVVVEGGRLPSPIPQGPGPDWLLLGTSLEGVTLPGRLEKPRVGSWDMGHPLLRGLDLSQLGIRWALKAREGGAAGRALVRTSRGAPLLLVRKGPPKVVHLLFFPGRSTLGAQLLLPRFTHRCLSWFSGIDPAGRRGRRPGGGRPDPEESDLSSLSLPPPGPRPSFALPGEPLGPPLLLGGLAFLAFWVFLAPSGRKRRS